MHLGELVDDLLRAGQRSMREVRTASGDAFGEQQKVLASLLWKAIATSAGDGGPSEEVQESYRLVLPYLAGVAGIASEEGLKANRVVLPWREAILRQAAIGSMVPSNRCRVGRSGRPIPGKESAVGWATIAHACATLVRLASSPNLMRNSVGIDFALAGEALVGVLGEVSQLSAAPSRWNEPLWRDVFRVMVPVAGVDRAATMQGAQSFLLNPERGFSFEGCPRSKHEFVPPPVESCADPFDEDLVERLSAHAEHVMRVSRSTAVEAQTEFDSARGAVLLDGIRMFARVAPAHAGFRGILRTHAAPVARHAGMTTESALLLAGVEQGWCQRILINQHEGEQRWHWFVSSSAERATQLDDADLSERMGFAAACTTAMHRALTLPDVRIPLVRDVSDLLTFVVFCRGPARLPPPLNDEQRGVWGEAFRELVRVTGLHEPPVGNEAEFGDWFSVSAPEDALDHGESVRFGAEEAGPRIGTACSGEALGAGNRVRLHLEKAGGRHCWLVGCAEILHAALPAGHVLRPQVALVVQARHDVTVLEELYPALYDLVTQPDVSVGLDEDCRERIEDLRELVNLPDP